jgi:hypothetical protein
MSHFNPFTLHQIKKNFHRLVVNNSFNHFPSKMSIFKILLIHNNSNCNFHKSQNRAHKKVKKKKLFPKFNEFFFVVFRLDLKWKREKKTLSRKRKANRTFWDEKWDWRGFFLLLVRVHAHVCCSMCFHTFVFFHSLYVCYILFYFSAIAWLLLSTRVMYVLYINICVDVCVLNVCSVCGMDWNLFLFRSCCVLHTRGRDWEFLWILIAVKCERRSAPGKGWIPQTTKFNFLLWNVHLSTRARTPSTHKK